MIRFIKVGSSWKWSVLIDDCVALTESDFYPSFARCSDAARVHVMDILHLGLIVDKPRFEK